MMDPIERFEEEHQHALAELEKLEAAARAMAGATGDAAEAQLEAARAAHEFLSTVVRAHNENEELALFSVLGDEAPTEPFVEDHAAIRAMERRLLAAIESQDTTETAAACVAIVDVLRDHIDREDNALFPMARELLGPEGLLEVARRLEG
ncbi:MAG: hemerythrin domain-containing protein [Gemmatimonadales bacterium]